jgi:hypothetical protein
MIPSSQTYSIIPGIRASQEFSEPQTATDCQIEVAVDLSDCVYTIFTFLDYRHIPLVGAVCRGWSQAAIDWVRLREIENIAHFAVFAEKKFADLPELSSALLAIVRNNGLKGSTTSRQVRDAGDAVLRALATTIADYWADGETLDRERGAYLLRQQQCKAEQHPLTTYTDTVCQIASYCHAIDEAEEQEDPQIADVETVCRNLVRIRLFDQPLRAIGINKLDDRRRRALEIVFKALLHDGRSAELVKLALTGKPLAEGDEKVVADNGCIAFNILVQEGYYLEALKVAREHRFLTTVHRFCEKLDSSCEGWELTQRILDSIVPLVQHNVMKTPIASALYEQFACHGLFDAIWPLILKENPLELQQISSALNGLIRHGNISAALARIDEIVVSKSPSSEWEYELRRMTANLIWHYLDSHCSTSAEIPSVCSFCVTHGQYLEDQLISTIRKHHNYLVAEKQLSPLFDMAITQKIDARHLTALSMCARSFAKEGDLTRALNALQAILQTIFPKILLADLISIFADQGNVAAIESIISCAQAIEDNFTRGSALIDIVEQLWIKGLQVRAKEIALIIELPSRRDSACLNLVHKYVSIGDRDTAIVMANAIYDLCERKKAIEFIHAMPRHLR